MTRNIVAKFGGTSVKTAEAIRQVGKIVATNSEIRVVVTSAVGGVTNLLVSFFDTPENMRALLVQKILDIHLDLAKELGLDIQDSIVQKVTRLNNLLNLNSPEMVDFVLSLGEDLSSMIVCAYLISEGLEVNCVDIRSYLITDEHFGKATPNLAAMKKQIEQFPSGLCVTQGFIGSTPDGRTTTLGRGGSDYSAALLAENLNADELLIYTDVPGVYTMDPNIVQSAQLIPELSFQEMAEMANFGAKILHPATLEPCLRARIPVRILSTFEPDKPGTYITIAARKVDTQKMSAVTIRKSQILVTIKSLKMLDAYGFLANIFNVLSRNKVSVDLITTSEVSVALTIDSTSTGYHTVNSFITNEKLFDELKEFAEVIIEDDLTLLAVIGPGLTDSGNIQKILGIIEPYMIRLVCYGASNSSISILAHKNEAIEMAKLLHKHLLGNSYV